jgi:hypothetical protein
MMLSMAYQNPAGALTRRVLHERVHVTDLVPRNPKPATTPQDSKLSDSDVMDYVTMSINDNSSDDFNGPIFSMLFNWERGLSADVPYGLWRANILIALCIGSQLSYGLAKESCTLDMSVVKCQPSFHLAVAGWSVAQSRRVSPQNTAIRMSVCREVIR